MKQIIGIVLFTGFAFSVLGCGEASKAPDTSPAVGQPISGGMPTPPPIPPKQ